MTVVVVAGLEVIFVPSVGGRSDAMVFVGVKEFLFRAVLLVGLNSSIREKRRELDANRVEWNGNFLHLPDALISVTSLALPICSLPGGFVLFLAPRDDDFFSVVLADCIVCV